MDIVKCRTTTGEPREFKDDIIGSGGVKDVYFSPDKSYVVAFYRDSLNWRKQNRVKYTQTRDRLETIAGAYHQRIFEQAGGDYWRNLFCWPDGVVEVEEKGLGIVAPAYDRAFFFEFGSQKNDFLKIKGHEKQGKWFASPKNRDRYLDERELGTWLSYLRIGILLARAVARLHAAGLSHSDLSYKNCLINPLQGQACVIDLDSLVVPQKYPPEVAGTPDFIAPEVLMTLALPKEDPRKKTPSIATDRHALAVLIYMYLLYRHPLKGDKVHDPDPTRDDLLGMGEKALFIEHETDSSNHPRLNKREPWELPWLDCDKLPYTLTGPYLSPLFKKAFVDGLHQPEMRPAAAEWETALVKTVDLAQPCGNPTCGQKWYVFDNTRRPVCPFCGTPHHGKLPVLNLYSARIKGSYKPDNHRLMVYKDQSLFPWQVNRDIYPNASLGEAQKRRVGYFTFHRNDWWLVNENLPDLENAGTREVIPIGGKIALTEGLKLLLSREEGGRLALVQMVES